MSNNFPHWLTLRFKHLVKDTESTKPKHPTHMLMSRFNKLKTQAKKGHPNKDDTQKPMKFHGVDLGRRFPFLF